MSDPVADLHVHTTNSDGTLELADVPGAARRAGLGAVAITDHDRLHPGLDAPVSTADGVTVIHGIELRVAAGFGRVDLLGYGVEPTSALLGLVERLGRDRAERGAAMVERLEDRLGADLGVEPHERLGRPHVARAVAEHPGTPYDDVGGVFEDLIGDGAPCYVPRDVPDAERGRALLADACALVGLAHPFRYDDPEAALALAADLDAVERWYPYEGSPDPAPVERAIDEHGLVPTGGSDAHHDRLGRAGLPAGAYRRFRGRLDGDG